MWDLILHGVVALFLAALVLFNHWLLVFDALVYWTLREQAQHRYIIEDPHVDRTPEGEKVWTLDKRTFWDWSWFRGHHFKEIIVPVAVVAVACGVYELLIWFELVGN